MSASTRSADAPMSRLRTADLDRNERSLTRSSSRRQQTTESKKSSQLPRTASGAPDGAHAGAHAFAKPSRAQHDERSAAARATSPVSGRRTDYAIDAQQARERLDKKLKRLEPPARSQEAARPRAYRDQAEDQHHGRETLAEQNEPMIFTGGNKERARMVAPQRAESQERSPSKKPRPRAQSKSSPTRTAKAVWCGNNKRDKKLRINGGHLEIGSPHACFTRGVGGGLYQDIPPGEEEAFVEKWTMPYEKLVAQPIWYKNTEPPHGMIKCTLPQALARGWAVGSKKRAEAILKQRGHTAHGA